ncbi:MAG TPA: FMN-binding negative transcriptional regulator [Azonexus sp.]|jgi:transcriptional regulator|nr:FMN-binding negative transcriptional regulator [Azonexus sp.]
MYLPKHFAEDDVAKMHALMRAHPLATLISHGPDGLNANHIPLLLADGKLQGHVARANPLWKVGNVAGEVLVIFHGHESYISPSGYATKAEHGKVVPTWNYVAVHAYGDLRVIDDPAWIFGQISALTAANEGVLPQPWAVTDAPADYIERMLGAIVGIEIGITRLLGKWKVSQNQPPANQTSLTKALAGTPMAELIRQQQQQ